MPSKITEKQATQAAATIQALTKRENHWADLTEGEKRTLAVISNLRPTEFLTIAEIQVGQGSTMGGWKRGQAIPPAVLASLGATMWHAATGMCQAGTLLDWERKEKGGS